MKRQWQFLSILIAGLLPLLSAPKPKSRTDYNYSNGAVGTNTKGMGADEAGDIEEESLFLKAPQLQGTQLAPETTAQTQLQSEENSQK